MIQKLINHSLIEYNDYKFEMEDLITELNICRHEYYNNNKSIISDYEYDKKYDRLQELENILGISMANSPTQSVGYIVKSELEKVKHSHSMLSLDKTKDLKDIIKFMNNHNCELMCKLDGLTVLLTYENGELIKAETRGNGEIGEDITHNARVFSNIPLKIPYKEKLEIEGEAIITYKTFEKINNLLPKEQRYSHPRNLVSGSVRQLDSKIAAERDINFLAWKIPTDFLKETKLMRDRLQFASDIGFDIVSSVELSKYDTLEEIEMYIYHLKNYAKEEGIPIDGMVITYDDIEYGQSLGTTGHHPKHSLAYKFYDEEFTTTLLDIEWDTSKTGLINPVAVFEPVDLDGAITTRATLHNISYIESLQLGIGDKIQVYRANMVIPKVSNNLTKSDTWKLPTKCPACYGKVEVRNDNGSKTLWCLNDDCNGKFVGKLIHFASKNAMDIAGLSEATIEKFYNLAWIESFDDVYKLKDYKTEMSKLEGFGIKSTTKLLDAIENSKSTTLDRFIYAMSIPLIGRTASKDLSKYCSGDVNKFIDLMKSGFRFSDYIDGFGNVMQQSLSDWWYIYDMDFIQLSNRMNFMKNNQENSNSSILGKIFVVTGSLNHFKNRDELVKEIETSGGKVSGSVSSKTNYLINNDIESTSGKNKKAKELNIPIITEEQFIELLGKEK